MWPKLCYDLKLFCTVGLARIYSTHFLQCNISICWRMVFIDAEFAINCVSYLQVYKFSIDCILKYCVIETEFVALLDTLIDRL